MNLELSTLVLKYASLRVIDPGRVARLVGALSREDQRSPVLVVGDGVLVDGYHRVEALRELGRDLVAAVRLEVSEPEALVLAWRLETGRRRNALEEGWLLAELIETHGRSQTTLATDLRRTRSWVSQRLGLVRSGRDEVAVADGPHRSGRVQSPCLRPERAVDRSTMGSRLHSVAKGGPRGPPADRGKPRPTLEDRGSGLGRARRRRRETGPGP